MTGKTLLDSNIWVYALTVDDPEKRAKALALISGNFDEIVLTPQILLETYHVLCRKKSTAPPESFSSIEAMPATFPVQSISAATFTLAVETKKATGYTIWDSMVLAAALEAGCETVYSEDMQDGRLINGSLRIVNPFVSK